MNLLIDIGNTMTKLAVHNGHSIVMSKCSEKPHKQLIEDVVSEYPAINRAIACSTGTAGCEVVEMVRSVIGHCMEFSTQTPVPIKNAYLTPETLGCDRLAAAVGAITLYPESNLLVVDLGTAITIDLISSDGTFQGGFISPGVLTRLRSLHDYTARLPMCDATDELLPIGRSTLSAIEQGVMTGITYEIEGHISSLSKEFGDIRIIFTGGDAKFFVKRIKNTIFANCDLVFCGLNRILEYNACKEDHN